MFSRRHSRDLLSIVQHASRGVAQQIAHRGRGHASNQQILGTAGRAPNTRQMALAASRRTHQDRYPYRPVGPAVDPIDGGGIAFGDEKIFPPESWPHR